MNHPPSPERRLAALHRHRSGLVHRRAWFRATVAATHGVKRALDIVGSAVALVLLTPLFLVVAVLIRLEDPGAPILFVQERVGRHGRVFPFPKFRSMVHGAAAGKDSLLAANHHGESITFKMREDPRVTRVGRVIRKLSIDEFPQFWSVLVGHMSLVGPRPALPREVARYRGEQRSRLGVKPGLTCFWQVGGRGDLAFEEQVRLDLDYIHGQTLWLDLVLLLKTVPAVLTGRGAY